MHPQFSPITVQRTGQIVCQRRARNGILICITYLHEEQQTYLIPEVGRFLEIIKSKLLRGERASIAAVIHNLYPNFS